MRLLKVQLFVLTSLTVLNVFGQQGSAATKEIKYRRSSLTTILIESDNFPKKDVVIQSYFNAPFPDKYNDHSVGIKSFNPNKYKLTADEIAALNKNKSGMAKLGASAMSEASKSTGGMVDGDETTPVVIDKFIQDNNIGNKLVAKWFNRNADGGFNSDLIAERGLFDASFLDTKKAQASSDGAALLKSSGFDLIENTFVVFTKMNFVANEPVARAIRDAAKAAVVAKTTNAFLQKKALAALDLAYEKGKEGYSVWTTSYLYKLRWNDSISNVFYTDYYMENSSLDPKKKAAFDNSKIFKLEFIGQQRSTSLVLFSFKNRTEEQIINLATTRNIDNVFAKLQKTYEVFRPRIPLFTGNPITAKIGTKEGLTGGEKFEVLEWTMDPKTGKGSYIKKGKIKVDKNLIWDNRFNLADGPIETDTAKVKAPVLDRTTFKGGSKYYSGLLIKQIK